MMQTIKRPHIRVRVTAEQISALDSFTLGYIESMLWTQEGKSADGNIPEPNIHDLHVDLLAKIISDCAKFQADNAELLNQARSDDYNTGRFYCVSGLGADAEIIARDLRTISDAKKVFK